MPVTFFWLADTLLPQSQTTEHGPITLPSATTIPDVLSL